MTESGRVRVRVDWYFDVVSPFAYLQFARLHELPPHVDLRLRPVLLAPILAARGQLGPAEIATKRAFTYRHVLWLAARAGVPLRFPAGHPFNPLPLLRLVTALGGTRDAVARAFRYVWVDGHLPQDATAWAALLDELGVPPDFDTPDVKARLRATTDEALAAGVFGVPTAIADGELFWGYDATDMLLEYCRDPAAFRSHAYGRAVDVPVAAARVAPRA